MSSLRLLSPGVARHASLPLSCIRQASITAQTSRAKKGPKAPLVRIDGQFKTFKPITPSIRHLRQPLTPWLYKGGPLRELTFAKRGTGGRNANGRITVRGRGGGHKRRIRQVDFMRLEKDLQDVVRIEYDPNRSAHIALLRSRDAESKRPWSYILAPEGLSPGDTVQSFRSGVPKELFPEFINSDVLSSGKQQNQEASSEVALALGQVRMMTVKTGNVLPLRLIPPGTQVHAIALHPDKRMALVRSAGTFAVVLRHDDMGKYSEIRLQSGEIRKILQGCPATIGRVGNSLHNKRILGKAGRSRWLGRRPKVRGVAMNAVDHPHGGGRGKSKSNKHPRSPWGWLTQGKRTRRPHPNGPKGANRYVIQERPRGKEKRGR